jgi:hypothetical protein
MAPYAARVLIRVGEFGNRASTLDGDTDRTEQAKPREDQLAWTAQTDMRTRLMSKQRKEHPEDNILVNKPFIDEISEWMDSPEGEQWTEISDALEDLLKDVQLDAKQRKFIWPDSERLDLDQSVERIKKQYPDFPREKIDEFLIDWIDMLYEPKNYSQAQLDELDRLTEQWVADHTRRREISKKGKRTRRS